MSAGSLAKSCGFITLLMSVILPSVVKLAGDCMRNANKSPKIPYSATATMREVEKQSKIHIRDRITTNSQSVVPISRPNHNTKFH